MLTREIMGMVALAILWVNAVLIAAAAFQEISALWRRLVTFRASGTDIFGQREVLVHGKVVSGLGSGGILAEQVVAQVGRAVSPGSNKGGAPTIGFWDRRIDNVIGGGLLEVGNQRIEVRPAEGERAEVWIGEACRQAQANSVDPTSFEALLTKAKGPRGCERTVRFRIEKGAEVFVYGALSGTAIGPPPEGRLMISTIDPRTFCRQKIALAATFLILELAAAALCTALALSKPVFGPLSMLGGALGLAFFLGVQPLGVWIKNAVKTPDRAPLRGEWRSTMGIGLNGAGSPSSG